MSLIAQIKNRVDIHELAGRLGLEQPGGRGNYRSPTHDDKTPSLALYEDNRWKDYSADEEHGDVVDLVRYVRGCDASDAVRWLADEYGISMPQVNGHRETRKLTLPESIAFRASKTDPAAAIDYLTGRGISEETAQWAVRRGAAHYNDWSSDQVPEGQIGHGGPAVAFPCRRISDGRVMGIDMRYIDPALNGGLKTSSQGEKACPYIPCLRRFADARTIYVVESAINALSIESLGMARTSTLATRGSQNWSKIDWSMLTGKRVIVCMDADAARDDGHRVGPEAAWKILEQLTALNIPAQMVDQAKWYEQEWNDCNDVLQAAGPETLKECLRKIEPWLIPGLPGDGHEGRKRLFLPAHDWSIYWRYRTANDFTRYIDRISEDENGEQKEQWKDVCGFRVAGISQVRIADHNSVLSGESNAQPSTVFSISAQRPGNEYELERRVLTSERLHKLDNWDKFGGIFNPALFKRMLSILERTTSLTKTDAVNFVGLCWKDGKLTINEGADCYFDDPDQQCPYHALRFPSGTHDQARQVIEAYRLTYSHHAALRLLVWALGGHSKALLGYWPHMSLQGPKGSGKSVLTGRLERTIAMHMFGSEQIKTPFRLLCSVSSTSHPVGWEEISTNDQRVIDAAVAMLQQAYQAAHTTRGSEHTAFLMSAPVLMAGEDVPAKSLTGKMISEDLTSKTKGQIMAEDLPRFPLREWLQYLAETGRDKARAIHAQWEQALRAESRADANDHGANRMVTNYAAVLAAGQLLFEFAECPQLIEDFHSHLAREMNAHMSATEHDREPWVWILEHVFSDIDSGQFDYPYGFRDHDGTPCLIIKPRHIIQHLQTTSRYRQVWDSLPIKSTSVFKKQLERAEVLVCDNKELTCNSRRHQRMGALSLPVLDRWHLDVSQQEQPFNAASHLDDLE